MSLTTVVSWEKPNITLKKFLENPIMPNRLQLKIKTKKLFKSKFKKILYKKISEKNFNVNGNPLNNINEIKINVPKIGVVWITPLIFTEVREK